ncbi:Uncharacterised protein [Bordetella pertussis]|nr:Uncharacterised protein [Bordetella pertussis]
MLRQQGAAGDVEGTVARAKRRGAVHGDEARCPQRAAVENQGAIGIAQVGVSRDAEHARIECRAAGVGVLADERGGADAGVDDRDVLQNGGGKFVVAGTMVEDQLSRDVVVRRGPDVRAIECAGRIADLQPAAVKRQALGARAQGSSAAQQDCSVVPYTEVSVAAGHGAAVDGQGRNGGTAAVIADRGLIAYCQAAGAAHDQMADLRWKRSQAQDQVLGTRCVMDLCCAAVADGHGRGCVGYGAWRPVRCRGPVSFVDRPFGGRDGA